MAWPFKLLARGGKLLTTGGKAVVLAPANVDALEACCCTPPPPCPCACKKIVLNTWAGAVTLRPCWTGQSICTMGAAFLGGAIVIDWFDPVWEFTAAWSAGGWDYVVGGYFCGAAGNYTLNITYAYRRQGGAVVTLDPADYPASVASVEGDCDYGECLPPPD